MPGPRVQSVNVGIPKPIGTRRGRPVLSAIDKHPVDGRVALRGVNFEGDDQADRRVHGGPDKAVYAYAREDIDWWAAELGRDLAPGAFGENLTTEGVDCSHAVVGERWAIGDVLLEVCQPRLPCFKLGLKFSDPGLLRRFAQASRPGAYLRILSEGDVGAGDAIEVSAAPEHGVTVADVADAILLDEDKLRAAAVPDQLPGELREWMLSRIG